MSVSGALMQLDPGEFVGDRPRWLALMNGAKAAGVPLEVFCEWTSGQDHYARNDGEVAEGLVVTARRASGCVLRRAIGCGDHMQG